MTETETQGTFNVASHINRKRVKQTALEVASYRKNGFGTGPRFTRVSKAFLDRIDAKVRNLIAEEVRIHPSKGQTLL